MVVGRNNGVVGLEEFSNKRMCRLLFGPQESSRIKGVVALTGWSYGGFPLYSPHKNYRPCSVPHNTYSPDL